MKDENQKPFTVLYASKMSFQLHTKGQQTTVMRPDYCSLIANSVLLGRQNRIHWTRLLIPSAMIKED